MKATVAFISMLGVVALGTFAWTGGYSGLERLHGSTVASARTVTLDGVIHKVNGSNDYVLHLTGGEEVFLGSSKDWQAKGIKMADGDLVKLEVAMTANETCVIRSVVRNRTVYSNDNGASIWAGYECENENPGGVIREGSLP